MSEASDQFNVLCGVKMGKYVDPKAPKARVRSVKIELIEYNEHFACDVTVTRVDDSKETIPTKLWRSERDAVNEAKRIRDRLMRFQ